MKKLIKSLLDQQMRRAALFCQLGFAKKSGRIYRRCILLARRMEDGIEKQMFLARLYHGAGKCCFRMEEQQKGIDLGLRAAAELGKLNPDLLPQEEAWRVYVVMGEIYIALGSAYEKGNYLGNALECWMRAKKYVEAIPPESGCRDDKLDSCICQNLYRAIRKCRTHTCPEKLVLACLTAGRRMAEEGEVIKASAMFDRALAETGQWSSETRKELAQALCCYAGIKAEQGNEELAEEKIDAALKQLDFCPGTSDILLERADVWGCRAQLASTYEKWKRAAERQDALYRKARLPDYQVLGWRRSAKKWEDAGDWALAEECHRRAAEVYQRLPSLTPEQSCALAEIETYLGLCYYRQGKYDQELSCYEEAIRLRKEAGEIEDNYDALSIVYCNQADSLLKTGEIDQAEASYRAAEALLQHGREKYKESLARLYYEWAEHARLTPQKQREAFGLYTKAIFYYEKADDGEDAEIGEYLALSYNGRGVCRFERGDYAGEVEDCSQALRLRAQFPASFHNMLQTAIARKNRGECHELLGRCGEAKRDYEKAAELYLSLEQEGKKQLEDLELAELMISCGRMWDEQEGYEKAISWYSAALTRLEETQEPLQATAEYRALAHFRRGMDYCRTPEHLYYKAVQDYDDALRCLSEKGNITGNESLQAMVLRNRGDLFAAMNEYSRARQDFLQASVLEQQKEKGEREAPLVL